ncbi:hypothetical protein CONCODRAFT_14024 [Conidiobolus coronatus NRRL 28638]|uniref:Uncharacterized protein n=1 Tax=Conidiobolus coronatus (strain ATCC 28846 / CBS 209.66 / NRRL 28638) TaxID=796925 RepID=A0A137NPR1_CONC2|nr:hypothetical protein CONCODRAFT_14024 [Conidiobolus coronatus NRRL 28638]|eukprot:KXN64733.1 hypothetical protein CONCODRAFT_14024 [Conidiobolus coronatus NRRL 28638]
MLDLVYSRVTRTDSSSYDTIQREARISGRWLDLLLQGGHNLRRLGELDEVFVKRVLLKYWCRASIQAKYDESFRTRSFVRQNHVFHVAGTDDLSNLEYTDDGDFNKQEVLIIKMFSNEELNDNIFCLEYFNFKYTPHSFINHIFNISMRFRALYTEFGPCTLLSTFNIPWSTLEEVAFPIFKILLAVIKPFIIAPDLGLVHLVPEPIMNFIGSCYTAINLEQAILSTISVFRSQLKDRINCTNIYRLDHNKIYKLVAGYHSLVEKQSFSTKEGELTDAQGRIIPQYNDELFNQMPFDSAYKRSITRRICLHPESVITE